MEPVVYHEGLLLKRQRGLHSNSTKKLKFQERFCRLTSTSLDYYDPNFKKRSEGPKGQFDVQKIRIVEAMDLNMFGKEFCYAFQIGDLTEIMYFVAHSQEEMDEWLRAFRHAATDASNQMLGHYHHGVFGLINKGRWSCCANTSRACHGCSAVTKPKREDLAMTLPPNAIPSSRRVLTGSADGTLTDSQPTSSKSSSLPRGVDNSPNNHRHSPIDPSTPPMVRSFTFTDPLMKPNAKRLKDRRKVEKFDEKEESVDKDTPIKIMDKTREEADKMDSNKLLSPELAKSGEIQNGSSRSGASSPSPSDDSGRGASTSNSRPSSQIDHDVIRKSTIATSDEGEGSNSPKQIKEIIKGNRLEQNGASSDGNDEEKYRDRGSSASGRHKIICEEPDGPTQFSHQLSSPTVLDDSHHQQKAIKLRAACSPRRPVSYTPSEGGTSAVAADKRASLYSSGGSDVSVPLSPYRRRHAMGAGGLGGSQTGDRPRSIFQVNGSISLSPLSGLHQACKDGNMHMLEEELKNIRSTECLDERSLGPIPKTPLFIAFINDHYQTMLSLLEHGANPNAIEPVNKASVLHLACEKGSHDIADLFIKYKANVNQKDGHGNTPLMAACKNGHLGIAQLLLQSGAHVDDEGVSQRTCLHEAAELGDVELVELLLKGGGADPISRDSNDLTPYDLAYNKNNKEVLSMLHGVIPEAMRPYSLLHTFSIDSCQMITSLTYHGNNKLIAGSRDCNVYIWDTSDLSKDKLTLRFTNTILDIDVHGGNQLVVGSTTVQLINLNNFDKRRTIADDMGSDENLLDPALHRVKFGPKGHIITAGVEGSVLKLWPIMSSSSKIVSEPDTRIMMGQELDESGCIYSISVSPTPNSPWIAVSLQPGRIFAPKNNKLVYCLNSDTKKVSHIFDAGSGGLGVSVHTIFSRDGQHLVVGCAGNLCIWRARTGDLLHKFTVIPGASVCSLCYSPDCAQLAVGLSTGEVQVFEIACSSSIFLLPPPKEFSPATAVAYSEDGKHFAVGHRNGSVQIWEVCS